MRCCSISGGGASTTKGSPVLPYAPWLPYIQGKTTMTTATSFCVFGAGILVIYYVIYCVIYCVSRRPNFIPAQRVYVLLRSASNRSGAVERLSTEKPYAYTHIECRCNVLADDPLQLRTVWSSHHVSVCIHAQGLASKKFAACPY